MPLRLRRFLVTLVLVPGAFAAIKPGAPQPPLHTASPTHAGYFEMPELAPMIATPHPVLNSSIYYAFFEAQQPAPASQSPGSSGDATPIVLWLQGGPGCASTFGGFFELGPFSINPLDLTLEDNPGNWNRRFGLLLLDQPVGSGYSMAASNASIPRDEMEVAAHVYSALQQFFQLYSAYQSRPLFITGESYAGKYVPSAAHYILQCEQDAQQTPPPSLPRALQPPLRRAAGRATLMQRRLMPGRLPRPAAPLFFLAGIAIGNGLTDPRAQTLMLAPTAFSLGLLSGAAHQEVMRRADAVVRLIDKKQWVSAHDRRNELREYIVQSSGLVTMYDTRRDTAYDATKAVDRYLNLPEVKAAMKAHPQVQYQSCSETVGDALAGDVMRSVKHLLPDLLDNLPVLLYQGQFDILDGVASSSAWISTIAWRHARVFEKQNNTLWYLEPDNSTSPPVACGKTPAGSEAASTGASVGVQRQLATTHRGGGAALAQGNADGGLQMPDQSAGRPGSLQPVAAEDLLDQTRAAGSGGVHHRPLEAAAGWTRSFRSLTHTVVYRAGHMVPHDQPIAARQMLEGWVGRALAGQQGGD